MGLSCNVCGLGDLGLEFMLQEKVLVKVRSGRKVRAVWGCGDSVSRGGPWWRMSVAQTRGAAGPRGRSLFNHRFFC